MLLYGRNVLIGLAVLVTVPGCTPAQDQPGYAVTIDIIECRPQYERECIHFYEHNWKVFRAEAFARNFISGYQLLRAIDDSNAAPTLLLVTEYPDSVAFAQAEDNFQPIMRALRPDGPSLLNGVPRSEFVGNRTAFTARTPNPGR
jgi:hypothetical protein